MENMLFEESYYGKLPEFEECEGLLASIIKAIRADIRNVNPNKMEENKRLEKIFSKIFGFKKSIIYWTPLRDSDMHTITCSAMLLFGETKDFIIKRPDRGFYDTSKKTILTIYTSIGICEKHFNITEQELLAMFLHEIGHNFDANPYHLISFWVDNMLSFRKHKKLLEQEGHIEDLNKIKKDTLKETRKENNSVYRSKKIREEYNDYFDEWLIKTAGSDTKRGIFKTLMKNNVKLLFATIFAIPIQVAKIGYSVGEVMADDFAASYGYGKELHSGIAKVGSDNFIKYEDTSKPAMFMRDMNLCIGEIFYAIVNEHGSDQGRAKQSIRKLEYDLKTSDYPEELKSELKQEIDRLRNYYYEQLQIQPNEKYKNLNRLQRFCDLFFDGEFSITKYFVRKARKKAR